MFASLEDHATFLGSFAEPKQIKCLSLDTNKAVFPIGAFANCMPVVSGLPEPASGRPVSYTHLTLPTSHNV